MNILIVGKPRSGKSRKAKEIAKNDYVFLTKDGRNQELLSKNKNIIVEECTKSDLPYLKQLITSKELIVDEKYKKPTTVKLKDKNFIFITQDKDLINKLKTADRRLIVFEYI